MYVIEKQNVNTKKKKKMKTENWHVWKFCVRIVFEYMENGHKKLNILENIFFQNMVLTYHFVYVNAYATKRERHWCKIIYSMQSIIIIHINYYHLAFLTQMFLNLSYQDHFSISTWFYIYHFTKRIQKTKTSHSCLLAFKTNHNCFWDFARACFDSIPK